MPIEKAVLRVKLKSETSFPAWSFIHFLHSTESVYRKLAIISRVLDLIDEGVPDASFSVATDSAYLFQTQPFSVDDFERTVPSVGKGENWKQFWTLIRRLERPVVFLRSSDHWDPIYKPEGATGLRILSASHTSPFSVGFEGIGEVIHELRFGHRRERREQEIHEQEIRRLRIDEARNGVALISEMTELQQRLEDSTLSDEAKREITKHVNGLVRRQLLSNGDADIRVVEENQAGTTELPTADEL